MKRPWLFALIPVAVLIGLGVWYVSYRSSPSYSLAQIRGAMEDGNRLRFQQYVDLDRFLSEAVDQLIGQAARAEPADNGEPGFALLGAAVGQALVDQVRPAMIQALRTSILEAVESGRLMEAFPEGHGDPNADVSVGLADLGVSTGASPQTFERIGRITQEGELALVEMRFWQAQLDTTLTLQVRMERVDRRWVMVAPENLDSYLRRVESLRTRRLLEVNAERRSEVSSYVRFGMAERQRERVLAFELIEIRVPITNVSDSPIHIRLGWLVPPEGSTADRETLLSPTDHLAPGDSTVLRAAMVHRSGREVAAAYRLDDLDALGVEVSLLAGEGEETRYVGPFDSWEQYSAWSEDPRQWAQDLQIIRAERGDSNLNDILGRSSLGPWSLIERTDPLDDSPIVTLMNAAESGRSRFGDPPTLILRCRNNRTEVFINWDEFLGTNAVTVQYRVDEGEMRQRQWGISTTNRATFFRGNHIGLIRELMSASQFVARVTPSWQSPMTAVFDVTGLTDEIGPLQEACNWS